MSDYDTEPEVRLEFERKTFRPEANILTNDLSRPK